MPLLLVILCGIIMFTIGFYAGYASRGEDDGSSKVKKKLCAHAEKDSKVETWGADGTKFVSVPRALTKAKGVGLKLLKEREDVSSFIKFCEIELEGELQSAELSWAMISNEYQPWIDNEYIRDSLAAAVAPEGFCMKWSPSEEGSGPNKIFISIIGRKV